MKVSEKQLLALLNIARHSTRFIGNFAGYDEKTRINLVNDIMNQQSDDLIDIKDN